MSLVLILLGYSSNISCRRTFAGKKKKGPETRKALSSYQYIHFLPLFSFVFANIFVIISFEAKFKVFKLH